ncbi:hypothetical protein [Blastococcus sp. SYSU D00820]
MTCPTCGRASEPGGRFCAGCGTDLAATPPAPPPSTPTGPVWTPAPGGPSTGEWTVPAAGQPQPWAPAPGQPAPQQPAYEQPTYEQPAYAPPQYEAPQYETPQYEPQYAPQPDPGYPGAQEPSWTVPPGAPDQQPPAPRKRRWVIPAVAGGAVVLAGGVAAAAVFLSSSGAGSPDEAVANLASALSSEDPAGVVAVLEPGEFAELADVYEKAAAKAKELGVDEQASSDTFVSGLDLQVEGLQTDIEMLSDNVARVNIIGGELTWDVAADELSPELREALEANGSIEDASGSFDLTDLAVGGPGGTQPFLMAVDNGDGWYVSPLFTIAEYAVQAGGLPSGDYDRAGEEVPEGAGGQDPEDAVQTLVGTLNNAGLVAALEQATDQAGGVFAVYQDALLQSLREEEDVDDLVFDIDVSTRAGEVSDGRAAVSLLSITGTVSDGYDTEDVDVNVACPSGDPDSCFEAGGELLSVEDVHVIVEERDGQWVIDPLGTVWDYLDQAVEGFDEDALLQLLAEQGLEEFAQPSGSLDTDETTEVPIGDAGFAVYTFDAEDGVDYTVSVTGDSYDYASFAGAHEYVDAAFSAATYPGGGEGRVVVWDDDGDGTASVALYAMPSQEVAWGQAASGTVAGGACVQHRIDVGGTDLVSVTLDSGSDVGAYQPDGQVEWVRSNGSGGDVFDTDGGTDFDLQVCNFDGEPADYELFASEYTGSGGSGSGTSGGGAVDGASSVDGYVSGGVADTYHTVYVPAGATVTVEVTPLSSDLDVKVMVDGTGTDYSSETFDSQWEGDTESFELYGGSDDSYFYVEVGIYSNSPASSGAYTITVS